MTVFVQSQKTHPKRLSNSFTDFIKKLIALMKKILQDIAVDTASVCLKRKSNMTKMKVFTGKSSSELEACRDAERAFNYWSKEMYDTPEPFQLIQHSGTFSKSGLNHTYILVVFYAVEEYGLVS